MKRFISLVIAIVLMFYFDLPIYAASNESTVETQTNEQVIYSEYNYTSKQSKRPTKILSPKATQLMRSKN